MDVIFSFSFLLVAPFWLLMIVLPHWSWTRRLMQSALVVVPVAVLYAALVLPRLGEVFVEVINPTLASVAILLGSPTGATIAWAHFLAFDLFVGRWVYLDSRKCRINAWLIAPVLFFTLMLGPIGLLLYLSVRRIHGPGPDGPVPV